MSIGNYILHIYHIPIGEYRSHPSLPPTDFYGKPQPIKIQKTRGHVIPSSDTSTTQFLYRTWGEKIVKSQRNRKVSTRLCPLKMSKLLHLQRLSSMAA